MADGFRTFQFWIKSDHPDAEQIVRAAGDKIACELDWGNCNNATIEVVEVFDNANPELMQAWEFVPGWECPDA